MVWNTKQAQFYEKNTPAPSAFTKNKPAEPFLSGLLRDRDKLLIIGLILVLISEEADKKLIAALVFMLLT